MTRFKEGDVITFMQEDNTLITHGVVEVNKNGDQVTYTTKGDNNNGADTEPVLSENVVAEYTGKTVPYAGYFVSYAQSKEGSALLLILPGLLLLGYSGFTIWSAIRQLEPKKKPSTNQHKKGRAEWLLSLFYG